MKKKRICMALVLFVVFLNSGCTPRDENLSSSAGNILEGSLSRMGDNVEIVNLFDATQKITMQVMDCKIENDIGLLSINHFYDSGTEIISEDGKLNTDLDYNDDDESSALILVKQSVTNLSKADLTIYVNSSILTTNTTGAPGFNTIYFDKAVLPRDDRNFFALELPVDSTIEYTVGFAVGNSNLDGALYFCMNPFAISSEDDNSESFAYVELSV